MYAAERQERLVRTARTAGRVEVNAAAGDLGVTPETIRRDLAALERRGLLRRVHGGALPVQEPHFEPPLAQRSEAAVEQKERIADAAARLIGSGVRSIVLDAGSTTSALAALLPGLAAAGQELTVVTNSLPIASLLAPHERLHLHLLGGRIRRRTLAAVGVDVAHQLGELTVDIAFLGTNGVHPHRGLTTPNDDEAAAKRAMARCAGSVVALADSTKLGQTHLCRVCPLDDLDQIITDDDADGDVVDEIADLGVEVVRA